MFLMDFQTMNLSVWNAETRGLQHMEGTYIYNMNKDFSHVASRGRDGNPIKIDIGALTGDSKKDINMAETIFQNMGYSWEEGFTWHHIENTTSLLRVPTQIHQLVDHTGGMSMSGLK